MAKSAAIWTEVEALSLDWHDIFLVAEEAVGHDDGHAGCGIIKTLTVGVGDMPDGVASISFVECRGFCEKRHATLLFDALTEHLQVEGAGVAQL